MYAFMKALCRICSQFSASALVKTAGALTYLSFDLFRFRRKLLQKNLDYAFGDSKSAQEKLWIARESVRNFILTIFEMLAIRRYPLTAAVEVKGGEYLRQALEQRRGVYVLCFHMGNFEAMAATITQTFAPAHAVMKRVGSRGMTRFIEEYRRGYGLGWIKRQKKGDGFRGIQEVLAKNEIYGFIIDQARPGEPRLPFFQHPAKTNTSFAAIWRKTPAPIVPCYIYRTGFAKHVLVVKPILDLPVSNDPAQDVLQHSTLFNQVVESCVREHPEQYLWLHNRWK